MKEKKQKLAIGFVVILLIIAIYTGLLKPFIKNQNKENTGNLNSEKIFVPDFRFTDEEGNTLNFNDFKGKPIVINFWGTWCKFCVMEMGDFNNLVEDYKDDVNFIFLHVANNPKTTNESVLEFLNEKDFDNIKTYFDSLAEGTYMFGINSFPTTIYIDKDGYIFDAIFGITNYDKTKIIIDQML